MSGATSSLSDPEQKERTAAGGPGATKRVVGRYRSGAVAIRQRYGLAWSGMATQKSPFRSNPRPEQLTRSWRLPSFSNSYARVPSGVSAHDDSFVA